MEPWRVCMPVVADLHHFDEEQDPDSHQNEQAGSEFRSASKCKVGSESTSTPSTLLSGAFC
jgi:hypothetical protein